MSITKTFEDELEKFFEYELAHYPLSLFDAIGMRKTQKSSIYDCFKCVNIEIDNTNTIYIIDGYIFYIVLYGIEKKHSMPSLRNTYITYIGILVIT